MKIKQMTVVTGTKIHATQHVRYIWKIKQFQAQNTPEAIQNVIRKKKNR